MNKHLSNDLLTVCTYAYVVFQMFLCFLKLSNQFDVCFLLSQIMVMNFR